MKGQKRAPGSTAHATTASHHRKDNNASTTTGGKASVDDDKNSLEKPLSANRELYRNHRIIRLAVLEASKRFEDQKISRLTQQLKAKGLLGEEGTDTGRGAGLVLRRGSINNKESWNETEAVRKILQENQEKERKQLERVKRKAGRGRRSSEKTASDVSAMMFSPLTGEEKRLLTFDKTLPGSKSQRHPRRRSGKKTVSDVSAMMFSPLTGEEKRLILQENQEKERKQLERVKRKAGRGRRSSEKTASDVSAMMFSPLTGEEKRLLTFDKTPLGDMCERAPLK
eukprot:CAMPEP_0194442738 /NCGR_PEP_ID=MMETSP0176-20130528/126308_1 /TAXON_ID=216777 /ORGANISM="Proboscia alata, Strain PI-D3" /LENGTH=282 /DNA_ID=CAMNT_0039268887 /DNA_START=104 /DNA_END=952 /DNA_ORIENTATION=-